MSEQLIAAYEVARTIYKKYSKDATERLDTYRNQLEPYMYSYLFEKHGKMLEESWKSYQPPLESEYAYVIVERRAHPHFWFMLRNMAWAAPYMSVYLFCSNDNREFIESLLGDKASFFHICEVFKGDVSREEGKIGYNRLLTDYRFYETIRAKYILTIQMDNVIRRPIPKSLFVGDYWGNVWAWNSGAPGGGGATVRRVQAMIELCRKYSPDPNEHFPYLEDAWIAERTLDYPSLEFRKTHIMENTPSENPIILHQFWTFSDMYLQMSRDKVIAYWTHLLTLEKN